MSASDLVVFDTCTLPEYYNDVHTVLALPAGHVLTCDYGAYNVSPEAQAVLRRVKDGERPWLNRDTTMCSQRSASGRFTGPGAADGGVAPADDDNTSDG